MTRKLSKTAAGLGLLVLLTLSAIAQERQILRGHVPAVIAQLQLQPVNRLPAGTQLHLGINLPLRNPEALDPFLKDIQNPASPNFRHYLTPEQFNEKFGPAESDYRAVLSWAKAHGMVVTGTHPGRSMVSVDAAVSDVENALHVTMRRYQHPTEPRTFFAPDAEPSPDFLIPILAISGLDDYVLPHAHGEAVADANGMPNGSTAYGNGGSYNGNLFMGSDFRKAYAPDVSPTLTGSGQSIGLLELDGYTPSDITTYEAKAGLPNQLPQEVLVNGSNNIDNGDSEPPLDIEMAYSMAPAAKVIFYHGYGSNIDGILTEMADPQHGEGLPRQISCSWGLPTDPATGNCFARLAAQGQSYSSGSGDHRAYPVTNGTFGVSGTTVTAGYESYLTQCGGTELVLSATGPSETVWIGTSETSHRGSGGGIESTDPIPDYQKPVNMTAVGGSSTDRNVPDVALAADHILCIYSGTNGLLSPGNDESGTSAAAPLWAGFMALANQQAVAEGKPYIGFANPAIYAIAEGPLYATCFRDIVSGSNTWSGSPDKYVAGPGYDLCTGWGSPRGAALIDALVDFSGPVFVDFTYLGPFTSPSTTATSGSMVYSISQGPGTYDYPFNKLAPAVSAVSNQGTIIIKKAGASSETMTISKPVTIIAGDGAATIGK